MPTIDICNQRLVTQHLVKQTLETGSEVVKLLGAVQAQDYQGAKWALSQRTMAATDAGIEQELTDGAILRTHVLRPTWHFVAQAELRWMLELTGPRVKTQLGYYDARLGIDSAVLRRSRAVMIKALEGGTHLTRAELAQTLKGNGIRSDGTQRMAHLVMHAELDALICSGARKGKQFTYALLDERARPAKKLSRDEALYALGTRYFGTRGPATEDDFAWWSGLTKADAKAFVQAAGDFLTSEKIDGRQYWYHPPAVSVRRRLPLAHLLPNYDEYFIGFRDRTAIHATLGKAKVTTSINALSGNLLTINGQIVGGWTRAASTKSVRVSLKPLTRFSDAEKRAIHAQVSRYARFLGMPLQTMDQLLRP